MPGNKRKNGHDKRHRAQQQAQQVQLEESKVTSEIDKSKTSIQSEPKLGSFANEKPGQTRENAQQSLSKINTADNLERIRNSMQNIAKSNRTNNNTINISQSREKTMITETTCSVSNEGGGIVQKPQRFDEEELGLSQFASAAGQISQGHSLYESSALVYEKAQF